MTVWIGFIQWQRDNGFPIEHEPILQALDNFDMKDAILDLADTENPSEPHWPDADFIVGNPPFLGGKKLRNELGDSYVDLLYSLWSDRVRPEADLCCYWFEKARRQVESRKCKRAGLLATQGIRGGANRRTLDRIKQTGDIFFAVSDRNWIIDGANVHIAILGFDDGTEKVRSLDGFPTDSINPNLTSNTDITKAHQHFRSKGICVQGDKRIGPFELNLAQAQKLLLSPNPHNRPSSDVIRPWVNGINLVQERKEMWIIDFEPETTHDDAALYESVYDYLKTHVYPTRSKNRRRARAERWWIHGDPQKAMRRAIHPLRRFIATPCVSKHRLFSWLEAPTLPDCQLVVFARTDDFFFGILHSRGARGVGPRPRNAGT